MRRSGTIRRLSLEVSAIIVGLCLAADRGTAAEPAPDPVKLSNLVRQDCGSCHGLTLRGGLGKPLTVDRLAQWNREQLVHIILDGVPGTPMPGWRPLMSEAEAGWIANVLKLGTLR